MHRTILKKKVSKKQKHPFLHLWASYLKTGSVTIPQINTNFYLVPRIIVLKIRKDLSTTANAITQTPFCQQTDDNNDKYDSAIT